MKSNYWRGNQHINSFWIRAKKGLTNTFKGHFKIGLVMALVYCVYLAGYASPKTPVYAETIKTVEVETIPPVMQRIRHCESSGSHTKDGQVVFKANTNGTVDIGAYQVNSIWDKQATKLGYDLTVEKDNEAFAMYLYHTLGTSPWSASAKCWMK